MSLHAKIKKRLYLSVANYFKFWANISLKKWQPRVIMLTGSAGKTTMLNLLEVQLGKKAHYSHDANSAYGIAFDILGLKGVTGSKLRWLTLFLQSPIRAFTFRHHEKFYVVEADAERPNEARWAASWLRPEVSLWISIGRSHAVFFEKELSSGRFKNIDDAIAYEFSQIPVRTQKLAIIDADEPQMQKYCQNLSAKVVACSKSKLKSYTVYPEKAIFDFNKHKFTFYDPMPRDVAIQLCMLEPLMQYLELPLKTELKNYRMPPARSNFLPGKNGIKIIDSSYNAHIISVASILEMFKALKAEHKWLVIGDIVDQGSLESKEHKKLAQLLIDAKPEKLILVGRRTQQYTYPALKDQLDAHSFEKPQEALAYLESSLAGKETLVFKGSQYLEWIIEKLLKNPADVKKLARQDEAHRRRRQTWGLE